MSRKKNVTLYRGEDFSWPVQVVNRDGTIPDVTGWTVLLSVLEPGGTAPFVALPLAVLDGPGGTVGGVMPRASSLLLTAVAYDYEISRTDAGANAVLVKGTLAVLERAS